MIGFRECALFSNIAAMAKTGSEANDTTTAQRKELCVLGIKASEFCLTQEEFLTCGIVSKSCMSHLPIPYISRSWNSTPHHYSFLFISITSFGSSRFEHFHVALSPEGARAIALRSKLNKLNKKSDNNDVDLNYWREQNELLRGISPETPFGTIDEGKKAKRAK
jgi:hypothetical protein